MAKNMKQDEQAMEPEIEVQDFREQASVVEDLDDIAAQLASDIQSGKLHIEKFVKLEDDQVLRGTFAGWSHININDPKASGGRKTVNAVMVEHPRTKAIVKMIASYQIFQSCLVAKKGDAIVFVRRPGYTNTKGGFRVANIDVLITPADGRKLDAGYSDTPLVSDMIAAPALPAKS